MPPTVLQDRSLGKNVVWSRQAATNEVEWDSGSALTRVAGSYTPSLGGGNVATTSESGGRGYNLDARATMMSPADLSLAATEISFGRWLETVHDFMRYTPTAHVQDVGTGADITFANAGAIPAAAQNLVGAATGPIITGSGLFTNLNTLGGATTNGAAGVMIWCSGSDLDADNAFPRRIIWMDDSNIVLMPHYVTGTTGNFGAPLVDETPTGAVTIKAGIAAKLGPGASARAVNFQADLAGQSGKKYREFVGQKAVGFNITGDGPAFARLAVTYNGLSPAVPYDTSRGDGTVDDPPGLDTKPVSTDNGLEYMAFNGSTVLSGNGLVSWAINAQAEVGTVDDEQGSRERRGVDPADYAITGSFKAYDSPDVADALVVLATQGVDGPIDIFFKDPAGNRIVLGMPRIVSPDAFSVPGSGTDYTSVSPNLTASGIGLDIPPFIWQELAA